MSSWGATSIVSRGARTPIAPRPGDAQFACRDQLEALMLVHELDDAWLLPQVKDGGQPHPHGVGRDWQVRLSGRQPLCRLLLLG